MACLWTAPNMHYDGIGLNTASALDTLWCSNAVHMFTHPVSRSQQTSFFNMFRPKHKTCMTEMFNEGI